ncbi:XK-related protein 6-like [Mytilus californianus]|uniref:XK-related protein 6-like n=1 Tax=Mytilus californianus TaxID=6549 RepID=UPI0022461E61|nr:XK-related protein 6-like [Mytilus californianus]
MHHGWKSRSVNAIELDVRYHYKKMIYEDTDAAMLRMFEAFLESAPQLILQIYIILTETQDDTIIMRKLVLNFLFHIVRGFAISGSWMSVSGSLVSYQNALRASHNIKGSGLSTCGTILFYLWRACEGYLMIFCFQNVQDGRTRFRALFYYYMIFSENIVMLILWGYFTQHKSEWLYLAAIGTVASFMVIQIIVQLFSSNNVNGTNSTFAYNVSQTSYKNIDNILKE